MYSLHRYFLASQKLENPAMVVTGLFQFKTPFLSALPRARSAERRDKRNTSSNRIADVRSKEHLLDAANNEVLSESR